MPDPAPLKAGDDYRCPRCRIPHVVEQPYRDHTTAERRHLYITCRGQRYFVGQDLRVPELLLCECGCGKLVEGGLMEAAHPDDYREERG